MIKVIELTKLSDTSRLMLGLVENLNINQITPSFNLYHSPLEDLSTLISSIRQKGLLQPIIVRTINEKFEIVAGNRRYAACKALGWRKIVCHIIEADNKAAYEISLIENMQRRTLKPLDEARAFKGYVDEHGWGGISDLAAKIGKSVSYVDKRIRLLGLPENVLCHLHDQTISPTIAEELVAVDDKDKIGDLAQLAVDEQLSSRKIRGMVKAYKDHKVGDILNFQENIGEIIDVDKNTQRTFDKTIITLKLALKRFGDIIDDVEENWIIYEILMQHKNMLNSQIDLLIKQKKKI
jgi:ParB family transcriptional regulator, chromosome partitioning protein